MPNPVTKKSTAKNTRKTLRKKKKATAVSAFLRFNELTSEHSRDLTSTDWYFDKAENIIQEHAVDERNKRLGLRGWLLTLKYEGEPWFLLVILSICTAYTSYMLSFTSLWLSTIKNGYCSHNWTTPKSLCCLYETHCAAWITWDQWWAHGLFSTYFSTSTLATLTFAGTGIIFGLLAAWFSYMFSSYSTGSGFPECKTIIGGFVIRRFLGVRTLLIKTVGLALVVGSGLMCGVQGPLIHISACYGNILSRYVPSMVNNETKKREILCCAVSAGVSAAFGAPIGGVLFAVESIGSNFFPGRTMWKAFFTSICTVLVLNAISYGSGQVFVLTSQVIIDPNRPAWSWFEIIPFAMLGCLGGAVGAVFIRANIKFNYFRNSHSIFKRHPILNIFALCLFTLLTTLWNPFLRVNSTHLMNELFGDCSSEEAKRSTEVIVTILCKDKNLPDKAFYLFSAFLIKFVLTILTLGADIPVGLFIPSLAAGACLGRVVGDLMQAWHLSVGDVFPFQACLGMSQCVIPGHYALIGAAALMGGITRQTIALAVIMFELTGSLDHILPIMISLLCSKVVGELCGVPNGIYDCLIVQKGLQYISTRVHCGKKIPISSVMTKGPICLTVKGETLGSLTELLSSTKHKSFPVVSDRQEKLVDSIIHRYHLERILEMAKSENLDITTPVVFSYREQASHYALKVKRANRSRWALNRNKSAHRLPKSDTTSLAFTRMKTISEATAQDTTIDNVSTIGHMSEDSSTSTTSANSETNLLSWEDPEVIKAQALSKYKVKRRVSRLASGSARDKPKLVELNPDHGMYGRYFESDGSDDSKQRVDESLEATEMSNLLNNNRDVGHYYQHTVDGEDGSTADTFYLDLSRWVDPHPVVIYPDTSTTRVIGLFQSLGISTLLIINFKGRLIGFVKKIDILLHLEDIGAHPNFLRYRFNTNMDEEKDENKPLTKEKRIASYNTFDV